MKSVSLILMYFVFKAFQQFMLLASMYYSTFAGMHLYQRVVTRGQCFTIILEPKLAFMEFLALRCCMLFFFFLFAYKISLRNILNPISKEPFDSHCSTTSVPLSCSDRYPVKASCRSRAAASGNTAVAFFERTVFQRD